MEEEKKDSFDEIKEMQKTQELKKIDEEKVEDVTSSLDKTFVKEVKEAAYSNKEDKKKSKLPLIIFILLLVCCLCGLGVVYGPKLLKEFNKAERQENIENDSKKYSSYRISSNGLEAFDLYFLQLENKKENKVYSPLSIKYALAMLRDGASGNSKKEVQSIIGDYKAKAYPNNEHMSFANSMFVRNTLKDNINSNYVNTLKNDYGAEVIFDEFTSSKPINDWVSSKTFNLINNLVDDSTVKDAEFFLVNALGIDMNWKNQIHCTTGRKIPCLNENGIYSIDYYHEKLDDESYYGYSFTEYPYDTEERFYKTSFNGKENIKGARVLADFNKYDIIKELGEDKIRETVSKAYTEWLSDPNNSKYLSAEDKDVNKYLDKYISEIKSNYGKGLASTDFYIYEDTNVKSFSKDLETYDGLTLQYVGIMPKEKELDQYVRELKVSDIKNIVNGLKEVNIDSFKEGYATVVRGNIPFFKFEYQLELLKDLQKLGISDLFDINKADLSNMINGKNHYIGDAVHKANIEFSNDGIKAAAATSIAGFGSAHGGFDYTFKIPVEEIDISFNKPYMYIIRDKDSGEVWFAGTVYDPISK